MTNQGAPEAMRLADSYAKAHAMYCMEDLYGTSKSYTAELLKERHAARERLAAALVEAQQAAPSAAAVGNFYPHAELRKTWQPGQRWQARSFRNGQWGPWTDAVASEPFWFPHQDYRRHPDDLAPQPSPTPQADSQPAPEYVGNGMFKGETIEKAAEHWANWCDRRCMTGLSEFLRVVAARAQADSVTAPAGGAVAGPALAPSAFVNAAGIKADDKPGTVVRKLDAAFHDAVTFADAAMHGGALWCVNIQGPDDVIAMPSKSAALEHANDLNALFGRHPYEEGDPIMRAVVIEWPHSADSHAADLVIQDATHGAAPTPPAQAADSVLEDAARLERERICAAIKAEDDYCVDQGDYMLDSDDCIKIVRGEWVRPDFAIDAARKQGANHDNA